MTDPTERHETGPDTEQDDDGVRVVREAAVTQATEVANLPHADNPVDEASEDSFPASDPPTYSGRREPDEAPTPA